MKREKAKRVASDTCDVIKEIPKACADETLAVEFMEKQRWGDHPCCARCGSVDVYRMTDRDGSRNKRFLWRCRDCKRQYTVRIGTVFEDSRIPLRHWCYAFWSACASKKGVSALQIKRMTGLSYKSALFMMHRVRFAMTDDNKLPPKLNGIVEADETYVGGRPRYPKKGLGTKPDFRQRKTPVVAAVQRGGEVRATTVTRINAANVARHLILTVDPSARLMTDEARLYDTIGKPFSSHDRVNHSRKEYVRGDVHTNTIEGFFSLLKRGLYGTFHAVSKKHLHRYVGEFQFRYNSRKDGDGTRIVKAIRNAQKKRLTYQDQLSGRHS